MIRRLKFVKDNGGWFVDLPEWHGDRADLQMVINADVWLDSLCEGQWYVWVTVSDEYFNGCEKLTRVSLDCTVFETVLDCGGATYFLESYRNKPYDFKLWLCDVTKFVFGDLPEIIYYKKS